MPRPRWNGRRVTNALRWLLRTRGDRCWLCGHPGANSIDHTQPASTHPHLEWEPANWQPAHLAAAGHPRGCQHPGCRCPGNTGRGADPHTQPPTRRW